MQRRKVKNIGGKTINDDAIDSHKNISMNELPPEYVPIIYDISINDKKNYESIVSLSKNMCYPLFSFGFQQFLHDNKDKMEIVTQFKDKKKVYYVTNLFETKIDEYDASLDHISVEYFDINDKPKIISRAFYKLWEILSMFDIIPINTTTFTSAHIAEGPGAFIQATMLFRNMFSKNPKKDMHYAVTLDPTVDQDKYFGIDETLLKYYDNIKVHDTYSPNVAEKSASKDDGNITNPKTLRLFIDDIKTKNNTVQFVTADGSLHWENKNVQEQEATKLIISEITFALKLLENGGTFVCKIYETFTNPMCKIMYVLSSVFEECYIVKPLTSRAHTSEKYIVCLKYKINKKIVDAFEELYNKLYDEHDKYIITIFPELELPIKFKQELIKMNTDIANKQIIAINKIVKYINGQNYFGDEYHEFRNAQIKATTHWINTYYPNKKDFSHMTQNLSKIKNLSLNIHK